MISYTDSFDNILSGFRKLGIPPDKPGFCDHPKFAQIEKEDPSFLNAYAKYVHALPLDSRYLEKARKEIPVITKALHAELVRSGRKGACVDASAILFRILERESFWCYLVKGSLTLEFSRESGIKRQYFWTIDEGNFVAAHAWVVAPPFKVIDFTIRLQQNADDENRYLPEIVLAEETVNASGTVDDVFAPETVQAFIRRGIKKKDFFRVLLPHLVPFMREFSAQQFLQLGTQFKYIPTAIGAPDCALEAMIGMSGYCGKGGVELYQHVVRPALTAFQERHLY